MQRLEMFNRDVRKPQPSKVQDFQVFQRRKILYASVCDWGLFGRREAVYDRQLGKISQRLNVLKTGICNLSVLERQTREIVY